MHGRLLHRLSLSISTLSPFLLLPPLLSAQVTLDGTLGRSSALSGPDFQITADLGQQWEGNLFHSFGLFNLQTGESATFSGPDSVANIIGRVTGGQASWIDGTLRSTIPDASLYLLNPAGLLFGENARLDVQGSFHASTADYLRLGEEGRFDVRVPQNSLLSVAPPRAFGFLGDNPAPITVQSSILEVPSGETLSLIGGDIELTKDLAVSGNLIAPSGRINIASAASSGEVVFNGPNEPADLQMQGFEKLGRIEISRLLVPQEGNWEENVNTVGDPAGTIFIRGGQLTLNNGAIQASSEGDIDHPGVAIDIDITGDLFLLGEISASSYGSGNAGDIHIEADRLHIQGGPVRVEDSDDFFRFSSIASVAFASGDSGNIEITTENLLIEDFGAILANTLGSGTGGDIKIDTDELQLRGSDSAFIGASAFDRGDAGNLTISADHVLLQGGGTSFTGLTAQVGSNAQGAVDGGDLRLTTQTLEIHEGAQISVSIFGGSGNAGNMEITADTILITGRKLEGTSVQGDAPRSGIFSGVALPDLTGKGGNIHINARELTLDDGGAIAARSFGLSDGGRIEIQADHLTISNGAFVSTFSFEQGKAGDIDITGDILVITGFDAEGSRSGIYSGTQDGVGGNISVMVRELNITDRGAMGAQSYGLGDAGNIVVQTQGLEVSDGAFISTTAFGEGKAGGITIDAERIRLAGPSVGFTGIFAEASTKSKGANDIEVHTDRLEIRDGAKISSLTIGPGDGGTITITADEVLIAGEDHINGVRSSIDARTVSLEGSLAKATGRGGDIVLQTKTLELRNGGEINVASESAGAGGNITLITDHLILADEAAITANSTGTGNAGSLNITARDLLHGQDSTITTQADQAAGGNITINARSVQLFETPISASVTRGEGGGGNVTFNTQSLVTLDNSDITARADEGFGGNITINADVFLRSPDVDLDASSNVEGNEGQVEENTPEVDISASLVTLPASYLDASQQLSQRCAAADTETRSSFVVRGTGSVPSGPDGPLVATVPCQSEAIAQFDEDKRQYPDKTPLTTPRNQVKPKLFWDGSR